MLTREGKKWISTTHEGTFETTPENAHYSIPVHLLEILEEANPNDPESDAECANKAIELYNMAIDTYQDADFLSGMTKECITPLLKAISQDYLAPKTCGIIANYALRESWYAINHLHDTDMLWELFKFYRDDVFTLTIREDLHDSEQYARIASAFYRNTGYKPNHFATITAPIHNCLNMSQKYKESYSRSVDTMMRIKNASNKNNTHGKSRTYSIYADLLDIPKILADLAMKFNNAGYSIDSTQKEEYQLVQKCYIIFNELKYESTYVSAYDTYRSLHAKNAYTECFNHGWYGFCFIIATLVGLDTKRNELIKEVGDYKITSTGAEVRRKIKFIISLITSTISFIVLGGIACLLIVIVGGIGFEFGWAAGVIALCSILGIFAPSAASLAISEIKSSGNYHVSVSESGHVYYWK